MSGSVQRDELLFVSTRFLFPADSGGKIRTSQILRGMKGGRFALSLASPAPPGATKRFGAELEAISDRFVSWPEPGRGRLFPLWRMRHLPSRVPVPVATDRSAAGAAVVNGELRRNPAVVVVDFPHAAVLAPERIEAPSVLFTHNVESWIFARHARVARDPLRRWIWAQQQAKMERFEAETLARFDAVVAVSEGDAEWFRSRLGLETVEVIPTGVDLEFFEFHPPTDSGRVAFTGSMDWMANIDGIEYLLDEVWPQIATEEPRASMVVVGRNPPAPLVRRAQGRPWTFTGFVDDVRPHVRDCSAYVIPLRVGGGTRIKAFEAMAMGCPVVSTTIGVEGLPLEPERHYLRADTPAEMARAVVRLLREPELRERIATEARRHVEQHFSSITAARCFEAICARAARRAQGQQTPR